MTIKVTTTKTKEMTTRVAKRCTGVQTNSTSSFNCANWLVVWTGPYSLPVGRRLNPTILHEAPDLCGELIDLPIQLFDLEVLNLFLLD